MEVLEGLVAVPEVVGQLDHLKAKPAWAETFRRQHDQRLDEYFMSRSVQLPPRNHQHLENAAEGWSIGSGMISF